MRYRYDNKHCRLDLGSYPKISLKEARNENDRLRKELEQGHNPKIVRKLEKQAIINAGSLESIFRQWYESYCKKNKKMHHEICRSFELYVLPVVGDLPAEKITLHQWLAILEEHAEKSPAIAERILINSKQMLKWEIKRQLIPLNVLTDINAREDLQIKKVTGSRSLSDEEIGLVWLATNESRMAAKKMRWSRSVTCFTSCVRVMMRTRALPESSNSMRIDSFTAMITRPSELVSHMGSASKNRICGCPFTN